MLCDKLEGWDGGGQEGGSRGRLKSEGYVCTQLIHTAVNQKLTQPCKAIILQL